MKSHTGISSTHRQSGAVLIVGLIILLIITVFSMRGIQDGGFQSKMANHNLERLIALEAAEAGLRTAEAFVSTAGFSLSQLEGIGCSSGDDCFNANCEVGLCFRGTQAANATQCSLDADEKPPWLSTSLGVWSNTARHRVLETSGGTTQIGAHVRYIIEFRCYQPAEPDQTLSVSNAYRVYRITAVAVTPNDRGRAMVQSTYRTEHAL